MAPSQQASGWAGNAFAPVLGLSSSARDAGQPRLAVGLGGDVLVFWGEFGPAGPSAFQPRYGGVTVEGGRVQETNFDRYRLTRMREAPRVETWFVSSEAAPSF